ncbi:MAG: hypothetical protein ACOYWZ_08710 [Bacillota bacterium]
MKKSILLKKLVCFILCFCFIFVSSVNVVLAKGKDSTDYNGSSIDHHKAPLKKIDPMQRFILDSMDSKKNKDIAKELSNCTKDNTAEIAENLSGILKGSWKSKKGMAEIKDILADYLGYTPKAQLSLTMVINEGFEGVEIPFTLSRKIKAKINYDFTGNWNDDRGVKFMVKALQIFHKAASLAGEELVTVTYDKSYRPKIDFNRLENYTYITSSVSKVLASLDTLPFSPGDFGGFINHYETYINDCGIYGIFTFLYLLEVNNIPYSSF